MTNDMTICHDLSSGWDVLNIPNGVGALSWNGEDGLTIRLTPDLAAPLHALLTEWMIELSSENDSVRRETMTEKVTRLEREATRQKKRAALANQRAEMMQRENWLYGHAVFAAHHTLNVARKKILDIRASVPDEVRDGE